MSNKKINPSWERRKGDDLYSTEGIGELREVVYSALYRKYAGLAETMFEWTFGERFDECIAMSWGTLPEVPLFTNGKICVFEDPTTKDLHMLPFVQNADGLNIYGRPTSWHPVPVGWKASEDSKYRSNETFGRYMALDLDLTNSVIIKNDLLGLSDSDMVQQMVKELVENVLTMNQLQLLERMPYIFDVSEDNVLSAKQMWLAIAKGIPGIFTNKYGEDVTPKIVSTGVTIDPALFDVFDRFECLLLEQLGYPCVPISKRAQQSVSEVQSNDDKVRNRRMEKLRMREQACERIKKIFNTEASVVSVIDEIEKEEKEMQMQHNNADQEEPADE